MTSAAAATAARRRPTRSPSTGKRQCSPPSEGRPGPLVAIPRFGIAWENEPDGVLRMGALQPRPALLVDDVVGRSGHDAEVGVERGELVAEAGKGEEIGHHGSPSG